MFGLFDAEAALNPGGGMVKPPQIRCKEFLEKHPELQSDLEQQKRTYDDLVKKGRESP
ncbi:MAG: hypothetical protein MRQ11_01725 [Candidatus Midichloria mitochondrii]|uniref:hypothetical protein n=1 Tax=Candidatus Midichloria mitochondrii TaxID=234827 RepID=UPI00031F5B75|nr:hypothetical protein [Candidatus Midichloria mitochondrii]MDJ1256129.1 hypothetical protein [Candidatus Midichloria mitochondrii]MDJ1287824.1 hypothetical protein [Candidatus Midichloria mitochondrii]MDJ1298674.1 hypothetical protein [Candidatus Midichloria mitochondrii]MDJ1583411.1 hypothetical protein [Candidatus Midichloria mitochondrii]